MKKIQLNHKKINFFSNSSFRFFKRFVSFFNISLLAFFAMLFFIIGCGTNPNNGGSGGGGFNINNTSMVMPTCKTGERLTNGMCVSITCGPNRNLVGGTCVCNTGHTGANCNTCTTDYRWNTISRQCVRSYARVHVINKSNGGNFHTPYELAVDNNYIYVANRDNFERNSSVQMFYRDNRSLAYTIRGSFKVPYGIAVDTTTNYIYVANGATSGSINVQTFYRSNRSSAGTISSGSFDTLGGVAIDNSYIYVANYEFYNFRGSLQIFYKGNRSPAYNITGFNFPNSVAVDTNYIYVTNYNSFYNNLGNPNVQVFYKGNRSPAYNISSVSQPLGIAVDDNYIYVTDDEHNNIQILNKSSRINVYNISGSFDTPYGLTVDDNYIYVTNYDESGMNDNVQIFNK